MSKKRFQECGFLTRLWRRVRYYPRVPFDAYRFWKTPWIPDAGRCSWSEAWAIAMGHAHGKMEWYWTLEEVEKELGLE